MSIISSKGTDLLQFNPGNFALEALNLKQNAYRCRLPKSAVGLKRYQSQTISAGDMLAGIVNSCLLGNNFSQACASIAASILPARKSAMYNFMSDPKADWNKLTMLTAWEAYRELEMLTSTKEHCLIIDDSVLEHSGAKRMELVTRTFNHNSGTVVKGYTCLQMAWTDGRSCFPLLSKLVASDESKSKRKACTNPKEKDFDRRRHGAFIRQEACKSKPELVQGMIKAALRQGFDCSYVLMDSWFNYEPLLKWITSLDLDVIGMLKLDHRSYHRLDRKERSVTYKPLKQLWLSFKHKRSKGNNSIAGWEIVKACTADEAFEDGIKLKIVYLHSYSDPDKILVLASTDLSLSPERIVQLYARRWMVETGFFNQKEFLGLGSETRSVDFDNQNAFMCLAAIRATIFEFHRRIHKDIRTMGEIARYCEETMRIIPIAEAVKELLIRLEEFPEKLYKTGVIVNGKLKSAKRMLHMLLNSWFRDMIDYVKDIFDCSPKNRKLRSRTSKTHT